MTRQLPSSIYDPLPEDVASWLADHEWRRVTSGSGRAALWTSGDAELLQPTLREATDYDLRISQLLTSLSALTGQAPEALAEQMVHEGSDVTEWRAAGADDHDYSLPLEDGLTLVQSVRNAFVAAANASIQRRGYFGHSTLKAARDHARAVRMGQTRRGSYIVPIISRIPGATESGDAGQGRLDVDVSAQPFERRVMAQLAEGLAAVRRLGVDSDREPSQRELNEAIGLGVSHELCAALASALDAESFGDVDVSFSWARRASSHPNVRALNFPKAAQPVIHNMAEALRGSDVVAEQVLSGTIWQTKYERKDGAGSIKVRTQIGRRTRTVSVPLNDAQMHAAYEAAADDAPVFIRGQLVREQGRAWHFETVSEFGVAQAAPLTWESDPSENA